MRVVTIAGLAPVAYYLGWWFENGRLSQPGAFLAFLFAVAYLLFQVLGAWYVYWKISIPSDRAVPPGLTVDVYLPVLDESSDLVARTLEAITRIRYPHRTYVLDDGPRPEICSLATKFGADYIVRTGRSDHKAGNVNHALSLTGGEFVAIFDVDHVPQPEYLDEVLGHFEDERVGFVQPMVGYRNQQESYIARASSGQSDDVFGPTSMGFHGCGSATVWGAHSVFRRRTLESVGGYQPGLAEDLNTSLALHAAGWRSVYVPRLLARGLAPFDFHAHLTQHLKWSRGVLGTLCGAAPKLLTRLTLPQVVCYLVRMTYYTVGLAAFVHMALLAWSLIAGVDITGYLSRLLPLLGTVVLVRKVVGSMWERDPVSGWQLTGTALAVVSWPAYLASLAAAVLRIRFTYHPTPKGRFERLFLMALVPQIVLLGALVAGICAAFWRGGESMHPLTVVVAFAAVAGHWVLVRGIVENWQAARNPAREAAAEISLSGVGSASGSRLAPAPADGGTACDS